MRRCYILTTKTEIKDNFSYLQTMKVQFCKYGFDTNIITDEVFVRLSFTPNDVIINRTGSYYLAVCIERTGALVVNSSFVTKLGKNKKFAYDWAKSLHLPMVKVICDDHEVGIIKPIESKSSEIRLGTEFKRESEFKQKYLPGASEIRTYVVGNKPIISIERTPREGFIVSDVITEDNINVYTGVEVYPYVNKVLNNVSIDFGTVNFLLYQDEYYFNDIGDVPNPQVLESLEISAITPLFASTIQGTRRKSRVHIPTLSV